MYLPKFEYRAPTSVKEATDLLKALDAHITLSEIVLSPLIRKSVNDPIFDSNGVSLT